MYLTQGLHRSIATNPNGLATIFEGRRHTYTTLGERVARLAGGLRSLGLKAGDRVGLMAYNSDYYLETLFATPWAGGVIVPMNWRLTPTEVNYLVQDAGISIMIVDAPGLELVEQIKPRPDAWRETILIGAGHEERRDLHRYEGLVRSSEAIEDVRVGGDDLAGIYYTAGTTSRSKGVMLTHDNIVSNAINAVASMQFTDDTIYMHSAPMFHLADGTSTFGITLMAGCHTFVPRFNAEACLEVIERERVTNAQFVPTMIKMLLDHPDIERRDLTSLRQILYGANPIEDETLKRALRLLPNCGFVHGYGMTEVSSIATMLPAKYATLAGPNAKRRRSCGQAGVLTEVRVVDADDNPVGPGVVGEIVIRGPNVMKGYWNRPEETAAALRGGWMHSGDLGYMDESGFLYIADRLKDMIKPGGENVFALEVENVIAEIPAVRECAVIAVPDPKWGEAVHAIVVPRDGHDISPETVISYCRERMAAYKCPRTVEVRGEPLPLSAAGKILKTVLREPYWKRHAETEPA
jgi:long-chain acyl-CoA synthetase